MPARRLRAVWPLVWRFALAVVGVALLAAVVRHSEPERIATALQQALPWLVPVLLLEAGHIGTEVWTTRLLLGKRALRIAGWPMWRIHFMAYALVIVMPLGRAAGEALKATLLAPQVRGVRAATMATTMQAVMLVANAVASLVAAVWAAARQGLAPLTVALCLNALISVLLGLAVQLAVRSRRLARWAGSWPRLRAPMARLQRAASVQPLLAGGPLALTLLGRLFQALQVGLLLHAVGAWADLGSMGIGLGVHLLGATVGDLIPAQLGAIDGSFAAAAPLFGATLAQAVSVALLLHLVQLFYVILGWLLALTGTRCPREDAPLPPAAVGS